MLIKNKDDKDSLLGLHNHAKRGIYTKLDIAAVGAFKLFLQKRILQ